LPRHFAKLWHDLDSVYLACEHWAEHAPFDAIIVTAGAEMFLTVTGKFLVKEIGVEHPPGSIMGELGFLTPNNRRTMTIECIKDRAATSYCASSNGPVRTDDA
jgi:hypothetical protein